APIVNALLGVLEKAGMERLDPSGQPFDPNVAAAVVHEPGEGGEQVVAEVLRAGYAYQGRVLRPAMVNGTAWGTPDGSAARVVREGLLPDPQRLRDGLGQGDQERLPEALAPVPPGRQPG